MVLIVPPWGTLLDISLWLPLGEGFYLFINFPSDKSLQRSQYISTVKSWVSYSWFSHLFKFHLETCNDFLPCHFSHVDFSWKPATRQCLSARVSVPMAQWLLLSCTRCPVILQQHWLMNALSWGTQLLWICKSVFSDCFYTAPMHTLSCLNTELLGLSCCHGTSAPSSCSACAEWSQVGSFKAAPPFARFSLLWQS